MSFLQRRNLVKKFDKKIYRLSKYFMVKLKLTAKVCLIKCKYIRKIQDHQRKHEPVALLQKTTFI